MATHSEQRDNARNKAEALLARRKQQESERLTTRDRERKAMDDKIAHLRGLRLSKEAADREAAVVAGPTPKKTAKRT